MGDNQPTMTIDPTFSADGRSVPASDLISLARTAVANPLDEDTGAETHASRNVDIKAIEQSFPVIFATEELGTIKGKTEQEVVEEIQALKAGLTTCWREDRKIDALKSTIQACKYLTDCSVPRFYSRVWHEAIAVLDTFGNLVFDRIYERAKSLNPALQPDFVFTDIPEDDKDICRNWIMKTSSIRELIPRLYVELALLPTYRFVLPQVQINHIIRRLRMMCRGVGDVVVQCFARAYLARSIIRLEKQVGYVNPPVFIAQPEAHVTSPYNKWLGSLDVHVENLHDAFMALPRAADQAQTKADALATHTSTPSSPVSLAVVWEPLTPAMTYMIACALAEITEGPELTLIEADIACYAPNVATVLRPFIKFIPAAIITPRYQAWLPWALGAIPDAVPLSAMVSTYLDRMPEDTGSDGALALLAEVWPLALQLESDGFFELVTRLMVMVIPVLKTGQIGKLLRDVEARVGQFRAALGAQQDDGKISSVDALTSLDQLDRQIYTLLNFVISTTMSEAGAGPLTPELSARLTAIISLEPFIALARQMNPSSLASLAGDVVVLLARSTEPITDRFVAHMSLEFARPVVDAVPVDAPDATVQQTGEVLRTMLRRYKLTLVETLDLANETHRLLRRLPGLKSELIDLVLSALDRDTEATMDVRRAALMQGSDRATAHRCPSHARDMIVEAFHLLCEVDRVSRDTAGLIIDVSDGLLESVLIPLMKRAEQLNVRAEAELAARRLLDEKWPSAQEFVRRYQLLSGDAEEMG